MESIAYVDDICVKKWCDVILNIKKLRGENMELFPMIFPH